MALKTRGDKLPYHSAVDATMLTRASKLVSAVSSFPVQYNKAIVGRNAFAHESGIHQDGILKNAQTYEIMTPESVGLSKSSLVMGKHSGRHAFREKLRELGYELGENALQDAFARFKSLADRKKTIYDEDLVALVDDELFSAHERIKLVSLAVMAGTGGPQSAALTLDVEGVQKTHQATGNGPVDAIFNAIHALVPHEACSSSIRSMPSPRARMLRRRSPSSWLRAAGSVTARGADPDTLVASARGLYRRAQQARGPAPAQSRQQGRLERFRAKWIPVRVRKRIKTKT